MDALLRLDHKHFGVRVVFVFATINRITSLKPHRTIVFASVPIDNDGIECDLFVSILTTLSVSHN